MDKEKINIYKVTLNGDFTNKEEFLYGLFYASNEDKAKVQFYNAFSKEMGKKGHDFIEFVNSCFVYLFREDVKGNSPLVNSFNYKDFRFCSDYVNDIFYLFYKDFVPPSYTRKYFFPRSILKDRQESWHLNYSYTYVKFKEYIKLMGIGQYALDSLLSKNLNLNILQAKRINVREKEYEAYRMLVLQTMEREGGFNKENLLKEYEEYKKGKYVEIKDIREFIKQIDYEINKKKEKIEKWEKE